MNTPVFRVSSLDTGQGYSPKGGDDWDVGDVGLDVKI
jgi:hypothetical protein